MDRRFDRLARLLEGRSFESIEAVNAELKPLNQGAAPESPRELTPLERAQELAYDAWVLLAEEASTPDAAVERYERAVLAGAAALGADRFASLRGEFWGHHETRPYVRARLGLAQALRDVERHDEALAHYRALLELDPGDNQGVRYVLLVALLDLGLNDEAGVLLAEHEDDLQALWPYGHRLWRFRVDGGTTRTREAFDAAVRANPYVLSYLLDPDSLPLDRPPHTSRGAAAQRRRTSRRRSPTHSRGPMAHVNGWRRRRGGLRRSPAADGEVDRYASVLVHVKGLSTATPVSS